MFRNFRLGMQASRRFSHLVIHIILIVVCLIILFPVFWMVLSSFKTLEQIYEYPPAWIPNPFEWRNYPGALTFIPFALYFRNTLIIAAAVIVGSLISSTLVGYGFARIRFPGRDALFFVVLSTMMIPFVVRMVPMFLIFTRLGWIDTFLPLTVPAFFGTNAFFIFLARQFFLTIPEELCDAARIDGCSEVGIWWRIMLPLSKPLLAVITIFAFQHVWNDFLSPLIYLNDKYKFTVALGLRALTGPVTSEGWVDWNYVMAAATTMVLPMMIIFALSQRYFMKGVSFSGIKG